MTLTKPMKRALTAALHRERGTICPILGCHAAAETAVLKALDRRGLIAWNGPIPIINEAGIVAANAVFDTMRERPKA